MIVMWPGIDGAKIHIVKTYYITRIVLHMYEFLRVGIVQGISEHFVGQANCTFVRN